MKTFASLCTLLLVASIPLGIAGCLENLPLPLGLDSPPDNNTVDNSTVEAKQFSGRIYLVGPFSGALEDELAESLTDLVDFTGEQKDGSTLIAGNMVASLTDAQRTGLQATYQAKYPLVLIDATKPQIDAFVQIVTGSPYDFAMPDNVTTAEVYAVDLEAGGDMYQWVQYPPQALISPDDSDAQQSRANLLASWLQANGSRSDTSAYKQAKLAATTAAGNNELTQLASAFVDQTNIPGGKNNYQITHFVYSCHAVSDNSDWIYVQQQCVLNSSGEYNGRKTWADGRNCDEVGWYLGKCTFDTSMSGFENQPTKVGLIKSSPETANEEVEVKSGVEFDIGGEIGLSGEGGSATLSGGVKISNEQTVKVRDCKVTNMCNDSGNNAHWTYDFKKPTAVSYFAYAGITDPPDLAIHTFQPVNQWIWKMRPEVRASNAKMKVTFEGRLWDTWGYLEFIWKASAQHADNWVYWWSYYVGFPYPPIPQ